MSCFNYLILLFFVLRQNRSFLHTFFVIWQYLCCELLELILENINRIFTSLNVRIGCFFTNLLLELVFCHKSLKKSFGVEIAFWWFNVLRLSPYFSLDSFVNIWIESFQHLILHQDVINVFLLEFFMDSFHFIELWFIHLFTFKLYVLFLNFYFVCFCLNYYIEVFQHLFVGINCFYVHVHLVLKFCHFRNYDSVQLFKVFIFSKTRELIFESHNLFHINFLD